MDFFASKTFFIIFIALDFNILCLCKSQSISRIDAAVLCLCLMESISLRWSCCLHQNRFRCHSPYCICDIAFAAVVAAVIAVLVAAVLAAADPFAQDNHVVR